jgi:tRNA threonylcarbamoyladenosine biosynthesis protein TsaB
MSWILGIDTSSTDLGIGLFDGDRPVASYSRFLKNSHAEHIASTVSLALENNGVRAEEISHIAVARGPGSFTGLRIGFAFVKGFCFGGATKTLPVSSLRILACGARAAAGQRVIAAVDARRDEVFWARFTARGTLVDRETPDLLSGAAEFRAAIAPDDIVITDMMGYAQSTVFSILGGHPLVFPVERFPLQRGLLCAAVGSAALPETAVWKEAGEILPHYLREFTPPAGAKKASIL